MSIAALYDELARLTGSPVVELNRAVAVAMALRARGGAGADVDRWWTMARSRSYHLLPSVRAICSRGSDATRRRGLEFERAAQLTQNIREQELLRNRAAACRRARVS